MATPLDMDNYDELADEYAHLHQQFTQNEELPHMSWQKLSRLRDLAKWEPLGVSVNTKMIGRIEKALLSRLKDDLKDTNIGQYDVSTYDRMEGLRRIHFPQDDELKNEISRGRFLQMKGSNLRQTLLRERERQRQGGHLDSVIEGEEE